MLSVYLDEDFVDKKCIAVTSMLSSQSMRINRTEFITEPAHERSEFFGYQRQIASRLTVTPRSASKSLVSP